MPVIHILFNNDSKFSNWWQKPCLEFLNSRSTLNQRVLEYFKVTNNSKKSVVLTDVETTYKWFASLDQFKDNITYLTPEFTTDCQNCLQILDKMTKSSDDFVLILGSQKLIDEYRQMYNPELVCCPSNQSLDNQYRYSWESFPVDINDINLYIFNGREEQDYLDAMSSLFNQSLKKDRTGVGTYSKFFQSLKFNLRDGNFPLYTTKRVAFKTLSRELFWFLSGNGDTKILENQGVNIWKGNTSREFLDSKGLTHFREGELGAGYPHQWRHFGTKYEGGKDLDYTGKGFDQIEYILDLLHKDPDSRRMLLSAWNPADLDNMALPPCHYTYQVYTKVKDNGRRELSAMFGMRSNDVLLGNPFNIASYALLTYMLAKMVDMDPGDLIFTCGDFHLYANHLDVAMVQVSRKPRPPPKFNWLSDIKELAITQINLDHFQVTGYRHHPTLKAPMAV